MSLFFQKIYISNDQKREFEFEKITGNVYICASSNRRLILNTESVGMFSLQRTYKI